MTKPILDIIEESVQNMRKYGYSCPFNNLPLNKGCELCKLLFPEMDNKQANCPCNRLTHSYVKAIMRHFFPERRPSQMKAFKVVEKQTRHCTNWTLFKRTFKDLDKPFYARTLKFKRENPQWFPRYFKNRIIEAAPGSPGIFCFATEQNAVMFMNLYLILRFKGIIIEVEGLGEPTTRERLRIISGCGNTNITGIKRDYGSAIPAAGTLCFRSVKVLT